MVYRKSFFPRFGDIVPWTGETLDRLKAFTFFGHTFFWVVFQPANRDNQQKDHFLIGHDVRMFVTRCGYVICVICASQSKMFFLCAVSKIDPGMGGRIGTLQLCCIYGHFHGVRAGRWCTESVVKICFLLTNEFNGGWDPIQMRLTILGHNWEYWDNWDIIGK